MRCSAALTSALSRTFSSSQTVAQPAAHELPARRPAPGLLLPASMVHLLVRLLQVPRVSGGVRCLSFRDWFARLGTVSSGLARVVARDGLSFFKAAYCSPMDGPHLFVRLPVDARVVPVF